MSLDGGRRTLYLASFFRDTVGRHSDKPVSEKLRLPGVIRLLRHTSVPYTTPPKHKAFGLTRLLHALTPLMTASRSPFAVLLIVSGCTILAGMDSLAKILMQDLPPLQVTWARFAFHALIMVLLFVATGQKQLFHTHAPKTQLVRGLCMAGVNSTLYIALMTITLAEATAIMYLAPIIVTLFAGTLLGEQILRQHLIAVALGFLGVLVIIRPGITEFQPGLLLTLFSASVLALYFLLTRKVAAVDTNRTSLFYSALVGAVLLSLAMPFFWVAPSATQWLALAFMGVLGASGHFLFIKAYRLQPASELSPWLNAQVLAATLFSVLWLGDSLDVYFVIGASLIVGAGLMLWWQSRRQSA